MKGAIQWLEATFAGIPLPVLEVWGRLSYLVGLVLAVLAFGGFTFRLGERWGFGRERQAWDAKALASMPVTFLAITLSGYLGSFIVLVPGAQTLESLKDLVVFLCIVTFGYPALLTVPFAYGLADLIEGVPPEFLLGWLPGYFINPACFWIAYQLFGKCPDFRRGATWSRYLVFVLVFMLIEPVLWGFICSDQFTPQIAYRQITSALFFTTSLTWVIAPFAMLVVLPVLRNLGLFWAEIPGHVKERALGRKIWAWRSGSVDGASAPEVSQQGLPIRMFILLPFIVLVLVMVAATAYVTLRSAEKDAEKLALGLHEEVSENIRLRLDEFLARQPGATLGDVTELLGSLPIAGHGRTMVIHERDGLAPTHMRDPVTESALAGLYAQAPDLEQLERSIAFSFDHLTAKPLSRETWLARASPYRRGANESWTVLTILPEAFFLAGVRTGNSRSAMVFTVALLLSLMVAAVLAARVTEPLRNISKATEALAGGNLGVRVPSSRLEELSGLARSFNGMAEQLEESFASLTVEVEQRTRREAELEQSEERLKSSENRLRLAVTGASLGIWDWDIEKDELIWDDSMYALYGVNKGEFGGAIDAWQKRLLPEDVELASADVAAAVRGDREFESEFRIRRGDGSVRVLRGVGQTLRHEGRALRMVGINWDITDRRKAEAERSKLVHDLGERVKELKLLHAASRLFQRNRPFDRALLEELVSQLPAAWQYPECCEARVAYLGLEVATPGFRESPFSQVKPFTTSDGAGFIEVAYLKQCPAAVEGPFLAEERALLDSLTDMLVRYLELRKHQEGLEALVRERTAALVEAKEYAETASRAKSTFLATMSHEIRTPMNAILGFGQLMARESDRSPRDRERLTRLLSSGYHLLELINNVLEMSKIEAGRGEAIQQSFDLHQAVADVSSMVRERFEAKGLRFTVQGVEALPRVVRSDVGKLRQILINLLGNAAKFTDSGSVTLSAEASVKAAAVRLRFQVKDSGVGIAPEEIDHVFEPFAQTQSGQQSQTGTGLGLTISRDFARLLGGELRVESEFGKGTTFELELPAQLGSSADVPAPSPEGQVTRLAPEQDAPTILVVDDEPDSRRVLGELLGAVGIKVLEAHDGQSAVALVEKRRPDLIFMDVKMPEVSGIEATRRIRALYPADSLPIVLISASVLRDDSGSVLGTGANQFIAKPFRETEIWAALEHHLGVRFLRGPVVAPQSREGGVFPTREQVLALGEDTLAQLREAIELGYLGRIPGLLAAVGEEHRKTAVALGGMATNLEIERLSRLV